MKENVTMAVVHCCRPTFRSDVKVPSEDFATSFIDYIVEDDSENEPSAVVKGSFAMALKAAQKKGVPLLVVVAQSADSSDALWAALTDDATVAFLCGGQVVAWGAWAGSKDASRGTTPSLLPF